MFSFHFLCLIVLICQCNSLRLQSNRLSLNSFSTRINRFYPHVHSSLQTLRFKVAEDTEEDVEVTESELEFSSLEGDGRSSSLLQKLSRGAIPIAASVGFAVTPSTSILGRVAGAAAGGVAGFIAKRTVLDRLTQPSDGDFDNDSGSGGGSGSGSGGQRRVSNEVKSALKKLVLDENLTGVNQATLEQLAKKFRVPEAELKVFFTYVFADAVITATQTGSDDLLDLGNMMDFSDTIGFTDGEVGDGFALAATRLGKSLGRDRAGFYERQYPPELLLQASKLYFLADKMIRANRGFYGSRLDTVLSFFTPESYNRVLTDTCKNMFQNFVNNVLTAPENFSPEEMQIYKTFLSVSPHVSEFRPANMQNMIRESLQLTMDRYLKSADLELANVNFDALAKAKAVFGWNSFEFDATVEAKTLPVFEREAKKLLDRVFEFPDSAEEVKPLIGELTKSLNLDVKKARAFVMTRISEYNAEYMNKIQKVYEVAGSAVEPAYKILVTYSKVWEGLKTATEDLMAETNIPIPGLPFADMVRVNFYQLQLNKENEGKSAGVSPELFTLSESQQNVVKKYLSLPKLTSWVAQCISEGNYDENAKKAYQKLLSEFKVTDKEWQSTACDFYYQELQKVARVRAIPTDIDMKRLQSISGFLDCAPEIVSKVNMELLGDKYIKALSEAMNPTGVISSEYVDGLERLRQRLQLTQADAQTLLGVSARSRLAPVIKDLVDVYKSDISGTARSKDKANQKDKSRDPVSSLDNVLGYMEVGAQKEGGGPNVFMREALNLIDFFQENYLTQDQDISDLSRMPVTAVGVVSNTELLDAYKHYLITTVAEGDEELRQRYDDGERIFALVLGINPESQQKVKESLAYTAYKNMLKNILRVKESVDTQDLQQFAMLKERLGLDAEKGETILSEATKGAVLEHAAGLLRGKDAVITAEVARRFRSQVQSLGLDMRKDTGFNDKLVAYLYALEVQYIVDNDLESELAEAQETYDIPPDRAEAVIEACCKKYVSQVLNLAFRDAKKYNEKSAVAWTSQIVKYMRFISGAVDADGNKFSAEDKARLVEFYESYMQDEGADAEQIAETCGRLKSVINLTESYIPPLQGIDGLVGPVSGMTRFSDGNDKKAWAWGS